MAHQGQDFSHSASGQAQLKRDETVNQPSHADASQSGQDASYTTQATNFLQQTGEQVINIAQGAADAVKNTLGMNADDSSNPSNNPSDPSTNPHNSPNHANPTNPSART